MKKSKALIGILCLVSFISFSSCEKDDETSVDENTEESSARTGDDNVGERRGPHSKRGKAEFMAKLTEEEKAIMEEIKPVLDGIKQKKETHFASLDSDTQEKLKSRELTKEEHDVIKSAFEATLSADEIEVVTYMKSLMEKYKPEGAPMHKG